VTEILAHFLILIIGIIAYVILTIDGHDGTPVLTAVLGYGGGVGISKVTESK
jgi:hypothetical protein